MHAHTHTPSSFPSSALKSKCRKGKMKRRRRVEKRGEDGGNQGTLGGKKRTGGGTEGDKSVDN